MAIPKNLKNITKEKAMKIIMKHLKSNTGDWESVPEISDFVYNDNGKYKLIRPGFHDDSWETGIVVM